MTDEQKYQQKIVIAYLAIKLNVDEAWIQTRHDFLFNKTIDEIVNEGQGIHIIHWMEERLGIRPGQAF